MLKFFIVKFWQVKWKADKDFILFWFFFCKCIFNVFLVLIKNMKNVKNTVSRNLFLKICEVFFFSSPSICSNIYPLKECEWNFKTISSVKIISQSIEKIIIVTHLFIHSLNKKSEAFINQSVKGIYFYIYACFFSPSLGQSIRNDWQNFSVTGFIGKHVIMQMPVPVISWSHHSPWSVSFKRHAL